MCRWSVVILTARPTICMLLQFSWKNGGLIILCRKIVPFWEHHSIIGIMISSYAICRICGIYMAMRTNSRVASLSRWKQRERHPSWSPFRLSKNVYKKICGQLTLKLYLVPSTNRRGHRPFKAVMLGSNPAGITINVPQTFSVEAMPFAIKTVTANY